MIEFMAHNALVKFDGSLVRIIRHDDTPEKLAACENQSPRTKILSLVSQKNKLFEVYSHVAFVVDAAQTEFKIKSALDDRPNLILIEGSKQWEAAQPLIEEVGSALARGEEIFMVNIDTRKMPLPKVEPKDSSPEWQTVSQEIKATLLGTHKDGFSFFIIGIYAPEFGDTLYLQGTFPSPERVYLEVAGTTSPPYNQEIVQALLNAGWQAPSDVTPNFSREAYWHYQEVEAVSNLLTNTLQWCLFLDVNQIRLTHQITQDK